MKVYIAAQLKSVKYTVSILLPSSKTQTCEVTLSLLSKRLLLPSLVRPKPFTTQNYLKIG